MNKSIRNIFKHNIKLLGEMDKSVFYFREQQYNKALCLVANSIDEINLVLEAIIIDRDYFNLVDTESMLEMLKGILAAKKNKDYILLADLIELQLVNFLAGVQELIISKEEIAFNEEAYKENIGLLLEKGFHFPEDMKKPIDTSKVLDSGYRVEFTSCGQMTLAAENEGAKFYFHTNSRIQSEAFLLARHWYKEGKKTYIIYGFGMGYHISELSKLASNSKIEVYEADVNVVQLACAFADVKELFENERINIYYDPVYELLIDRMEDILPEEELLFHYPSYKNIRSLKGKKLVDSKFLDFKS